MVYVKLALVALVAALCFGAAAAGNDDDDYYRYKRNQNKNKGLKRITEALLRQEQIVPDVIRDVSLVKDVKFEIKFPAGYVNAGNFFTTNETASQPTVTIRNGGGGRYTLIMADPDAPSRLNPIRRNIWHWGVINIPASGRVADGTLLAPFRGPGPPPDGGVHRYTYLLFKQNGRIDLPAVAPNATIDRSNFSVDAFAGRNNLDLPIAANWFNCQNNNPVPPAGTPPAAAGK
jgi:phosphatidylethanolamine-binding protein (PEBP) family uncharacterized protein